MTRKKNLVIMKIVMKSHVSRLHRVQNYGGENFVEIQTAFIKGAHRDFAAMGFKSFFLGVA